MKCAVQNPLENTYMNIGNNRGSCVDFYRWEAILKLKISMRQPCCLPPFESVTNSTCYVETDYYKPTWNSLP
jgi:hypothetical protein